MSSPDFAGLQGISGTAVARRCALLAPARQQLLWWIQGMSLAEGGLRKLANDLVKMFPKRFVAMSPPELTGRYWGSDYEKEPPQAVETSIEYALGRGAALGGRSDSCEQTLEEFLIDLCINPRVAIPLRGEVLEAAAEIEMELARKEFPELEERDFKNAGLKYFRDIVAALVEYKRCYEERVRRDFCQTAISRQIWKQLDDALEGRTMVAIEGLEGRGKTEAVQAWCNCHLGVARFVSLKGTNTKTAHFRELARAFGVGHGIARKVSEMQARVEELVRTSKLMLVIDEAHFFFNQAPRMKTRPEMLDWVNTALCNPPTPVALVTTPQFMLCIERAANQVGWNYRQFKRRCKRYWRLPAKNSAEDIEAVAKHLLPGADRATIKQVIAYEGISKRDLSSIGDVVREATLLASQAHASKVTAEHVRRAIHEVLLVSDVPWAEMERRLRQEMRWRKGRFAMPTDAPTEAHEELHAPERAQAVGERAELVPAYSRGGAARLSPPGSAPIEAPKRDDLVPV